MKKFRYNIVIELIDKDNLNVKAIDILNNNEGYSCGYSPSNINNLSEIIFGLNSCISGLFMMISEDNKSEIIEDEFDI